MDAWLEGLGGSWASNNRDDRVFPQTFHTTSLGIFSRRSRSHGIKMLFSPLATLVILASSVVALATPRSPSGKCETKLQRKAWHTLTASEKRAYIDAELCLMRLPATLGLTGTKNRFEELQSAHQIQAGITHGVGAFLPFHRLHMYAHEELLRNECGYKGAQP